MWISNCVAIVDPQNYIARFGHGSAKLARQAQSKEKTLQKMVASGLTERVVNDKVWKDCFKVFVNLNQVKCLIFNVVCFFFRPCHFIFLPVGRSLLL